MHTKKENVIKSMYLPRREEVDDLETSSRIHQRRPDFEKNQYSTNNSYSLIESAYSEFDLFSYAEAIRKGNVNLVKQYFIQGLSPNTLIDEAGNTGLHVAIKGRNVELIQLLMIHNADIFITNKRKFSPVDLATAFQDWNVLLILINSSINKNNKHYYEGILQTALRTKNIKISQILLNAGVSLNFLNSKEGHEYFRSLIANKASHEYLKFLLEEDLSGTVRELSNLISGIPAELKDELQESVNKNPGSKPLKLVYIDAINSGNSDLIKDCLAKDLSPNTFIDNEGNTGLHLALKHKNLHIIKLLLENNANIFRVNKRKESALDIAFALQDTAIIMCFIQHIKNCPQEMRYRFDAILEVAFFKQHIEALQVLLEAGVPFNFLKSEKGFRHFRSLVADKESQGFLQFLLELDASGLIKQLLKQIELDYDLRDPVTLYFIQNPYITPQGITYGGDYIFDQKTDPSTRTKLNPKDLIENKLAQELLAYFKQPFVDIQQLPPCLICPETGKVFEQPVVAVDGITYEKKFLDAYLTKNAYWTPTGKFQDRPPYPNRLITSLIQKRYLAKIDFFDAGVDKRKTDKMEGGKEDIEENYSKYQK